MTLGVFVFLLGLFLVPLALLMFGHRIRRASARQQRAFWGAIAGHFVAGVLAVTYGMIPPESWTDSDTVRGFFGLWSLVVFPLVGALGAAVVPSTRQ